MATIVASRYAVLSVDDEGDLSHKRNRINNKKQGAIKPQNTTSKKPESNIKKKKKPENTQAPNSKTQNKSNNSGSTSKKKKEPLQKQWEEWKEKDDQFIEGNFEEDLSKAIFLSKLEYEQNKNDDKKFITKKKKGQKVMTLTEFNNLDSKNIKETSTSNSFKRIENKSECSNKMESKKPKNTSQDQLCKTKRSEVSSEESLTLVLYETYLENKNREIVQLKAEIERLNIQFKNETERLNSELKSVKTRNSQLCQIIANGEMKDKAEVLMEVERLQTIKDELSLEVSNLHIQLEQERSKVRQLSIDHKKQKAASKVQ